MLNLEKFLSMPEGKTIEFKQDLSSLQPIMNRSWNVLDLQQKHLT